MKCLQVVTSAFSTALNTLKMAWKEYSNHLPTKQESEYVSCTSAWPPKQYTVSIVLLVHHDDVKRSRAVCLLWSELCWEIWTAWRDDWTFHTCRAGLCLMLSAAAIRKRHESLWRLQEDDTDNTRCHFDDGDLARIKSLWSHTLLTCLSYAKNQHCVCMCMCFDG